MLVLIAMERSGVVRRAFAARGHEAYSCDLEPSEDNSPFHIQADARDVLVDARSDGWDLMIAHPDCTYLTSSGLWRNRYTPGRAEKTEEALDLIRLLLEVDIPKIAIENPVGCISTRIRPPDQCIQPYEFGHDASKRTCLWLKNLPLLVPTRHIAPRMVMGDDGKARPRWGNQTDSGQNRLGPSPTRAMDRARTYEGIAKAMAKQWG